MLDEAAAFVAERGFATRTPDCALPSLFEECDEEPLARYDRAYPQRAAGAVGLG